MEAYLDEPAFPYTYARWPRRIASGVIDHLVVSVLSVPFMAASLNDISDALEREEAIPSSALRGALVAYLVTVVAYSTVMHGWRGSTLGKMATRTVLLTEDGAPASFATAFVRAVAFAAVYFVSIFLIVPLLLNELRPLWHPRRMTFHDQVAKTIVVMRTEDLASATSDAS